MAEYNQHLSDRILEHIRDDSLAPAERPYVQAHLERCDACQHRLMAMTSVRDARHVALRDRLAARLAEEAAASDRSVVLRRGGRWRRIAAVAGVAAALAITLGLREAWQQAPSPGRAISLVSAETGELPSPALTPGATSAATAAELCAAAFEDTAPVPGEVRDRVVHAYGMDRVSPNEYEVDYLITPALGGVAEPPNLWPERYTSRQWNAKVKDQLEDLLPTLVCRGDLDLRTAQHDIAVNWIAAYKKYFRTDRPIVRDSFRRPPSMPWTTLASVSRSVLSDARQ